MTDFATAHYIRIRYHGPTNYKPSRLSVTWDGWPSDGNGAMVRKALAYTSDREAMARDAARMFTDWLSAGDTGLTFSAKRITLGAMTGPEWALLVETEARKA